jgi:hypothetical protein
MASLTRRGLGLAGIGALASAGVMTAKASGFAGFHGMSDPGRVRLKQIASIDMPRSHEHVMSMSWSPDGSRLVADSSVLNVFDMTTMRFRARFPIMEAQWPRRFGFSADGKELIASKALPRRSTENNTAENNPQHFQFLRQIRAVLCVSPTYCRFFYQIFWGDRTIFPFSASV